MYIEGRNAILESLRSKREFKRLLVQDKINKDPKVRRIISKAKNRGIYIKYVPKKELDHMSVTGTHQGFIGIVERKESLSLNKFIDQSLDNGKNPFLIYIREALYEYNVGAIIRTAECAGVDGVILPPKLKMSAEIIRASTGATEHINIFNESLFNSIKICKNAGIKTAGIEVSGDKYYYERDLTGSLLLIIGGEDRPLSMEIQKKCDIIVKIPLKGRINSLNMSVAASIVIYDKVRQESLNK